MYHCKFNVIVRIYTKLTWQCVNGQCYHINFLLKQVKIHASLKPLSNLYKYLNIIGGKSIRILYWGSDIPIHMFSVFIFFLGFQWEKFEELMFPVYFLLGQFLWILPSLMLKFSPFIIF